MRQIIIDLVFLAGFVSMTAGVYLQYGQSIACMLSGGLAMLFALIFSRK